MSAEREAAVALCAARAAGLPVARNHRRALRLRRPSTVPTSASTRRRPGGNGRSHRSMPPSTSGETTAVRREASVSRAGREPGASRSTSTPATAATSRSRGSSSDTVNCRGRGRRKPGAAGCTCCSPIPTMATSTTARARSGWGSTCGASAGTSCSRRRCTSAASAIGGCSARETPRWLPRPRGCSTSPGRTHVALGEGPGREGPGGSASRRDGLAARAHAPMGGVRAGARRGGGRVRRAPMPARPRAPAQHGSRPRHRPRYREALLMTSVHDFTSKPTTRARSSGCACSTSTRCSRRRRRPCRGWSSRFSPVGA